MKSNKLLVLLLFMFVLACSEQNKKNKNETWDFSKSRSKNNVSFKFDSIPAHADYAPGLLTLKLPGSRELIINHDGYHVYLNGDDKNVVDMIAIYLEEMTPILLNKKFIEIVKEIKLDENKYKFEIHHNKRNTFCYDFENINFCLRFRGGERESGLFKGFLVICIDRYEDE